ncbi:MAG: TonB-dependent receptor [Puniceicoccaceae bacterium]
MKRHVCTRTLITFSALLGGSILFGQENQSNDNSLVFELSPFEVSTDRDVGYLSTNSTSGTSLNIAIKDLPMAIQVVNQELIGDLQASTLNEALDYTAGVFSSSTAASSAVTRGGPTGNDRSISSASGGRFSNRLFIRGVATPYQNRDGFRNGGLVITPNSAIALGGLLDSVNMDRIEVVRGPNSLLYGVGVLTGIANVIAKKPLSENRFQVGTTVGSFNQLRGTADITGPLNAEWIPGELNWRIAGAAEARDGYVDYTASETRYWVAQLDYHPTKWMSVFLEYQSGYDERQGIGGRWILDSAGKNTEFRNEFDEPYNWARRKGEIEGLRPILADTYDTNVNYIVRGTTEDSGAGWKLGDETFVGGGFNEKTYRISGPDTFAERDEDNILIDLTLRPLENLTVTAGAFLTSQETEELNVNMSTTGSTPQALITEITSDAQFNALYESNGIYGIKMPAIVQDYFGLQTEINQDTHPGDWVVPNTTDDLKYVQYYWDREIVRADSEQYRIRAVYDFEHELFGSTVEHTLLAGFSYIEDDVDFPDGNLTTSNARAKRDTYTVRDENGEIVLDDNGDPVIAESEYTSVISNYPGGIPDLPNGVSNQYARDFDALHYRSIADFSPIRLGDSPVARAGDIYLNQVIKQEGKYFIYQGKFLNDRLNIVFGLREDSYNARQFTYDRVGVDKDYLLEAALNSVIFTSRNSAGGAAIPADAPGFSDQATKEEVLNSISSTGKGIPSDVQAEFDAWDPADNGGQLNPYGFTVAQNNVFADYMSIGTRGGGYITSFYSSNIEGENSGFFGLSNRGGDPGETFGALPDTTINIFEEDVKATSGTFGVSYAVTDNFSVYGVYSEGISPNTALRDGSGEIIPAERAENKEFGIKFDIEDTPVGRFSGSVAVYEIDRYNGIWNMPIAPSPASWMDAGTSQNRVRWGTPTYDPNAPTVYNIKAEYLNEYLGEVYNLDPDSLNLISQSGVGLVQQVELDELPDDLTRREKQLLRREISQTAIIPAEYAQDRISGNDFGGAISTQTAIMTASGLDELFEVTLYSTEEQAFVTKQISPFGPIYAAFMNRELDPTKNPLILPFTPIDYRPNRQTQPNPWNNPGIRNGALVVFDETITGYELELFWTLNENLQFIFAYSHTEREALDDFQYSDYESIVGTEINGFIAPFGEIYREYGWENAGYQLAWVDHDAYAPLRDAGDGTVTLDDLGAAVVEVVPSEQVDETISVSEMASRNAQGQIPLFVDQNGAIVDRNNLPRPSDYSNSIDGVSLNFNPEDEVTARFRYKFTESKLDGLAITGGVKYTGPSKTSVLFRSQSPLNELTFTPEASDHVVFDIGASYDWVWDNIRFRLRVNIYNLFDDTYDVTTTTLSTPNPITGQKITRRTERFYTPTTWRIGLSASF